jgi:7-carboxy-7-deazaguanine synthase
MKVSEPKEAQLVEIFSSIQGEGPRVGERQTFVRFQACDLKCRWCDTPESFAPHSHFRVEKIPFSGTWEKFSNPVSNNQLSGWLDYFSDSMVSLTGGEPLQQVDFLEKWLPQVSAKHKFLLETNGILPQALERIIDWIHTVSMDIKLPSSAKTGVWWKEHEAFLNVAKQLPECYVKIVVTEDADEKELKKAVELVRSVGKDIPVILQPASETKTFHAIPSIQRLGKFVDQIRSIFPGVRVIPQTHKLLGVL